MRDYIYVTIFALIALWGCERANQNIPTGGDDNGNDMVVEEPTFEVEFKHIGWYDIEAEITPPEGVVEYGCGVVESDKIRNIDNSELAVRWAHDDACHKTLYNKDIYSGYGYLDGYEYSLVIHYEIEGENEIKISTHEFKTEVAPEAQNSITSIELFGPYLSEDILDLDPTISEVTADGGAWYFYRTTTANDNIKYIYHYPTYQLGMLEDYASLFMLVMQQSWIAKHNYFYNPLNGYICVYAMVEDNDGIMSTIAESNILNNNAEARDAQEFVENYYAEHSAE